MLPQRLRLRRSADFVTIVKRGRKATRPTLVVYAMESARARVGLIVGRGVGGSVERNRVKRRLRHQARSLIDESAPMDVVIRALPPAGAPGADLAGDLADAWQRAGKAVAA